MITERVFQQYPNGMYFDEFVTLCENITSEFAYGVLDTINQQVPCVQNHFKMRANFK